MKRFLYLFLLLITLFSCKKESITSLVFVNKPTNGTMMVGDTFQMEVLIYPMDLAQSANVEWTSSNGAIASVDNNGLVVALSAGKVLIRAVVEDVYTECEVVVDAGQANFNFSAAVAHYYGDIYDSGTKNFELKLFESTIKSDENGNLSSGEGFMMSFNLNVETENQKINSGTYKLAETGKSFTFFPGTSSASTETYGSFLGQMTNSTLSVVLPIKAGEFKIEKSEEDENHKITFSLTGERGESLTGNFSGTIQYFDNSEENLIIKNYTFSEVEKIADTQNCQIKLQLKNGNDTLKVNFNMPDATNELLPNKTYGVSDDGTDFSIEKGVEEEGIQKGSWLCCENEAFPILSGEIIYSESKELEITLYSIGLKVIGSASGEF